MTTLRHGKICHVELPAGVSASVAGRTGTSAQLTCRAIDELADRARSRRLLG